MSGNDLTRDWTLMLATSLFHLFIKTHFSAKVLSKTWIVLNENYYYNSISSYRTSELLLRIVYFFDSELHFIECWFCWTKDLIYLCVSNTYTVYTLHIRSDNCLTTLTQNLWPRTECYVMWLTIRFDQWFEIYNCGLFSLEV